MNAEVNRYSLDPAEPSGRDVWWKVIIGSTLWIDASRAAISGTTLDAYIIRRAEAGCVDCISAILECENDVVLQAELRKWKGEPWTQK